MGFRTGRLLLAGGLGLCLPATLFPQERAALSVRAGAGGHSNVFLADTAPVDDVFGALEVEGDGEWSWEEGRLLVHGIGNAVLFRDRGQADEYFGFADAWLLHRLAPSLTLNLADFVTAFELQLVDRQGELLPGGRLRLVGNEILGGLEWQAGADTYLAVEAGYRSRNFEERDTLSSIDSGEPYAGLRLTRYLSEGWSVRGEARYGVQRYAELRARDPGEAGNPDPPGGPPGPPGGPSAAADGPELEIGRWEAEAVAQRRWGDGWRLELAYELRLDRDRFRGFQSFDQHGAEVSLRLRPDIRTLVHVEAGVADRRFDRQPIAEDADAPLRRERFWSLKGGVEWPVMDLGGARLSLLGRIAATRKTSNASEAAFDFVRGLVGTGLWF